MTSKYFFDSYAVIEILKMSENYYRFAYAEFLITKLNLFEIYYRILRESEEKAHLAMTNLYGNAVDFDETVIEQACKLKLANTEKNLSMADCIGYVVAMKAGVKFLTGDKEFRDMPNVEFVK